MALKLNPNPTFIASLKVRQPGGAVEEIELEMRHRDSDALNELMAKAKSRPEREVVADIVVGWRGMEVEFSQSNLDTLLKNYPGLASLILGDYVVELMNARAGN